MIHQFFKRESSAGILLIIATISALLVANSSLNPYYHDLMQLKFTLGFIDNINITYTLERWINDGLMAIFFLLVGLEIKNELKFGELNSVKSALFPTVTAIGGAIVPALIFFAFNINNGYADGWAIPMATDIAFVIGILALIGSKVPLWIKVFITTVAVVDDLIAVLIIAFFYTDQINLLALGMAAICLAILLILNYKKVYYLAPYLIVGFFLWWAILVSGVHATIAGVVLAFTIPLYKDWTLEEIKKKGQESLDLYSFAKDETSPVTMKEAHIHLRRIKLSIESPLKRLERSIHLPVYFLIMPLFAFINAGIVLNTETILGAATSDVSWGVFFGLLIGKPLGIFLGFWVMYKMTMRNRKKPTNLWKTIIGVGFLAGVGFTMSLFIANLSYPEAITLGYSKIGILSASFVSGLIGLYILNFRVKKFDPDGLDTEKK